jgi:methyl-accepting chemotaxis protein-1 (serine sensor receptor)
MDLSVHKSGAGKSRSKVTQAVARVTDIMGEVAAASREQSRGIEQVSGYPTGASPSSGRRVALSTGS